MAPGFNVEAIRRNFPVTGRMLYLDAAHQAPLSVPVKDAIDRFLMQALENAGPKRLWLETVERVRARMAAFIGAEPDELAFTKNTSEGLNAVAQALPLERGDEVLMIHGDHPNNACAFLNLRSKGIEVRFAPMPAIRVDAGYIANFVTPKTRVISLSHVTFHAGQRFDVESIGHYCAARNLFLVIDAMQSIGVLPFDVREIRPSCVAFGCHKGLLVPQGLGVLYVRKSLDLRPAYLAWAGLAEPPDDLIVRPGDLGLVNGARRFEIGNYNLPAVHGLEGALDLIEEIGLQNVTAHVLDLGNELVSRLDDLGIRTAGPRAPEQRSHITTLAVSPAEWIGYLDSRDVRVSPERCGVRVSVGAFNTRDDIDRFVSILAQGLKMETLRHLARA